MKTLIQTSLFAAVLALASNVQAADSQELDHFENLDQPQGVVVRVDEKTNDTTIFLTTKKIDPAVKTDTAKAEAVLSEITKAEKGELDQIGSTPAWYWYGYGCYWYRPAYYTYYNYSYYWSYRYYWRGYYWYYYW